MAIQGCESQWEGSKVGRPVVVDESQNWEYKCETKDFANRKGKSIYSNIVWLGENKGVGGKKRQLRETFPLIEEKTR